MKETEIKEMIDHDKDGIRTLIESLEKTELNYTRSLEELDALKKYSEYQDTDILPMLKQRGF